VFKARVIARLTGRQEYEGKGYARKVLAVVEQRFWGLPESWPSLVILDGGFFCNMVLQENTEYLVAGIPYGWWMVDVSFCSRTAPIEKAEIDLRTLDGSMCSEPGKTTGSLVGFLRDENGKIIAYHRLDLTDSRGNRWTSRTDAKGVFELRHVPPGLYTMDAKPEGGRYIVGGGEVEAGSCRQGGAIQKNFGLRGRLSPYSRDLVTPYLVPVNGTGERLGGPLSIDIDPSGRFFFGAGIPEGEYYLVASSSLGDYNNKPIYYPGVEAIGGAIKLRLPDPGLDLSFQVDPRPHTQVDFVVTSPEPAHPIRVEIQVSTERGGSRAYLHTSTDVFVSVPALLRSAILVTARSYSPNMQSTPVQLRVEPGMKPVRLVLHPTE
jgi:hypothetical protein